MPYRRDRPRVLIVEDEATLAAAYAKLFGIWGWDYVVAATVADAAALLAGPFALVTLDLMLPDGDGAAVLRAARALPAPPPVVVMTARGTGMDEVLALKPDRVFPKPYAYDALQVYAAEVKAEWAKKKAAGPPP